MNGKRLYDTLKLLKVDLYNIQGVVRELADAALPYTKDLSKKHTVLEKAIKNAYYLVGLTHDLN